MSNEGGLVNEKHGGVQGSTHESDLGVNIDLPEAFSIKTGLLATDQLVEHRKGIQNGDSEIDVKNATDDNLQFLSSVVDLDSYDRAVVENNAEWLKSRCRNIDTIDFDIPTSNQDAEVEFFGGSLSDAADIPLCAEGSVLDNTSLLGGTSTSLFSTATSDGLTGCNSIASIFSNQCQSTESNPKSSSLFEDKNNMLMTPQELENMPDRGLEFEASVGPKTDLFNTVASSSVQYPVTIQPMTLQKNFKIFGTDQESKSSSSAIYNPTKNLVQVQQPVIDFQKVDQNNTNTLQVVPNQILTIQNPKQHENSGKKQSDVQILPVVAPTQILVNVNQGQQILQINSASQLPGNDSVARLVPVNPIKSTDNSKVQPIQTGFLILPSTPNSTPLLTSGSSGLNVNESIPKPPLLLKTPSGNPTKLVYMYLCTHPGCDKIFRKQSKMRIHLMSHTGERPFKCSKPGCDWAFTTCYKLKRHEESHQGRKDFVCDYPECGKKFVTSYNLKSHKKSHERPCEPCLEPGCTQKFPNRRALTIHMKTHNGSEKRYKCPVDGCDKTFYSPHCMGSHPRTHQQDRDFRCTYEGCTKVFSTACRLKQHTRIHTGEKPFVCYFQGCGWAFTTASKLRRHQAKHTGLRKWKCPIETCGRAFMRSEHLKGHMITHTGKKPFECPIEGCQAKFVAKTSLKMHMKRHETQNEEKISYHCPIEGCVKKYSLKSKLREHMVRKHLSTLSSNGQITQLDLGALLGGELQDLGIVTKTEQTPVVQAVHVNEPKSVTPIAAVTKPDNVSIDPLDFITNTSDSSSDIPQISQAVLSQLISGLEKPDGGTVTLTSQNLESQVEFENNTESPKTENPSSHNTGSARTDYLSNHNLSFRAKQRRQLLKEKSTSASNGLDVSSVQNSNEENFLAQTPSAVFRNSTENPMYSPPSESLTSRGITFRDPETGVLYIQTQLLQDDPPSTVTDLYNDDQSLASDMSDLQNTSTTDLQQSMQDKDFTVSTINFQDLQ